MKLFHASLSKAGGREENEDCIGIRLLPGDAGCWVVADGLGGHAEGATASRLAVDTLIESFATDPKITRHSLLNGLECAHQDILKHQSATSSDNSMRTAITVLISDGLIAHWAHVGDVRLYVFRDGEVFFQTKDHSVPQALVNAGEIGIDAIRGHEDRNRLLRSLGSPENHQPSVLENPFVILRGDIFLLCTDGFWEYVNELEMLLEWCKSLNLRDWLERMELRILQRAPQGHDNYSAIALFADVDGVFT